MHLDLLRAPDVSAGGVALVRAGLHWPEAVPVGLADKWKVLRACASCDVLLARILQGAHITCGGAMLASAIGTSP